MGSVVERIWNRVQDTQTAEVIELPRKEHFEDFLNDCVRTQRDLNEHDARRSQLVEMRKHAQRRMADFMRRNSRDAGFDPADIDRLADELQEDMRPVSEDVFQDDDEYTFED